MKGMRILALGVGVLTLVSCKKNSVEQETVTEETPMAVVTTNKAVALSSWQSIGNWTTTSKQSSAAYTGRINDAAITTEITNSGLVLVFTKNGTSAQSLPFKQDGDVYWSYQVEQGYILVNADAAASKAGVDNNREFQYIVLSKEQLDALETNGHSRNSLINLSYQSAIALFQ